MALDNLLMQKIFVIQAERDSVYVSDEEVDQELDGRIAYFEEMFGGLENLESYYGKTITELKADFREDIFDQLLSSRMEGSITAGISVSPSEVRSFYQAIPQDSIPFFNAEVELAEVVLYEKPNAHWVMRGLGYALQSPSVRSVRKLPLKPIAPSRLPLRLTASQAAVASFT